MIIHHPWLIAWSKVLLSNRSCILCYTACWHSSTRDRRSGGSGRPHCLCELRWNKVLEIKWLKIRGCNVKVIAQVVVCKVEIVARTLSSATASEQWYSQILLIVLVVAIFQNRDD